MADPTVKKYDHQLRLTLSKHQKAKLKRTGNMNQYLRDAAMDRLRCFHSAWALLKADGWSKSEIRVVCDILDGDLLPYSMDKGEQIAASMEEEAELVSQKSDIPEERWSELASMVRDREPIARAVWAVQREYWGPSDHVDL